MTHRLQAKYTALQFREAHTLQGSEMGYTAVCMRNMLFVLGVSESLQQALIQAATLYRLW